jgi:FKBP-type peptidyl-prolyl cis-trans isomerase FkpA
MFCVSSVPMRVAARPLCRALVIVLTLAGVAACSNPLKPLPPLEITAVELRVGTGTAATTGRIVTVDYTGWLHDPGQPDGKGTRFESSLDPGGEPFPFLLGAGQVIEGWDLGVPGMRVGGLRRLTIPPELAYGSQANGPIPGNATLVFEIELLDVR